VSTLPFLKFSVAWDSLSLQQIIRFGRANEELSKAMQEMGKAMGKDAVDLIKLDVKGNGYYQPSTGATARGIRYAVKTSGNEVTVNFYGDNMHDGNNVAHMLDVGNGNRRIVAGGNFMKLSGRANYPMGDNGKYRYSKSVAPMGQGRSGFKPKQFSDNIVGVFHSYVADYYENPMQRFLDRLVY